MFKNILAIAFLTVQFMAKSQEYIYPAPANKGYIVITNGTVHVGNGSVLEKASVLIKDAKIVSVEKNISIPAGAKVIDAGGKQVYPGLILPMSELGLTEIERISTTDDNSETGPLTPHVRSIVAYNVDSKIINTLKSNGILLVNVLPIGGRNLLSGAASIVQLDAWSNDDAAYKTDIGFRLQVWTIGKKKEASDEVLKLLRDAKNYFKISKPESVNLKFEALRPLFDKKQKLFINAATLDELMDVIAFKSEFDLDIVIMGGGKSYLVADLLKQNNLPVIIGDAHDLPSSPDAPIFAPYTLAAKLQEAGVLYAINEYDPMNRGRNLPFNAGTYAAYGLTKEQALQAITLNTAKILGIDNVTGSIEPGKDANIIISTGDILDMRTSNVTDAFIQGRKVDLNNLQKQLYLKYKTRYGIN